MISASASSLARRSRGIPTVSQIFRALVRPMPNMYVSAISTRLLVGKSARPSASRARGAPVAQAAIRPDLDQAPHVHVDLTLEVAFYPLLPVDDLADAAQIAVAQLGDARVPQEPCLLDNILGLVGPNAEYPS